MTKDNSHNIENNPKYGYIVLSEITIAMSGEI